MRKTITTDPTSSTRLCCRCKKMLPVSQFATYLGNNLKANSRYRKDGMSASCLTCEKIQHKEYHKRNADRLNARSRSYYRADRGKATRRRREYRRKNRSKVNRNSLNWRIKREFGITLDHRDEMLNAQGGGCAICGTKNWSIKGPVIDHDHKTGTIRGILCSKCNTGLGMFGDDPVRVLKSAAYLLEPRGNETSKDKKD